jgi:uncharacterized lipoprotein YmbA
MTVRIAFLITALLLAGCGASRESRFFSLTETTSPAPRAAVAPARTIALGAVRLPAALDRPQMARRLGSGEISYSESERWAGPLDEMVRQVLTADLDGRLPPGVALVENTTASPADLTISINILRFDAEPAGSVKLDARWETLGRNGSLVGMPRDAKITQPGSGGDGAAIAGTMSRAVDDLAHRITAGMGASIAAIGP